MNGALYSITVEQMKELTGNNSAVLEQFARNSSPLIAGMLGDECICVFGMVPQSLLSDTAYLWLLVLDSVTQHKVAFARYCRRWLRSNRVPYTRLVGHCVGDDIGACTWVRWLGASFGEPQGGLIPFEIVRE